MAPMAANAAVVSTGAEVTTDDWTGATYSVTGGQVVVSGGGTITQAVETTLQPGKYQVYIATLINVGPTNPLNIKVDGADEGGEGSITINSDVVEFTLTSAKKVTLNITGTNKYTIAGVEIRLDKNFKALGDALEDMLQDVTLSINTYSVKADWDAENDRIKKVIEKIQKQDIATPDDDAYELYTDEELWNDAAATKTGKDIEALKQNAYKAEKDALEDAVKAAKATIANLPAYEANKQDYKDLLKAAEDAIKNFKVGDKSTDELKNAVSDLQTYANQANADQADIVAYYDGAHDPEKPSDATVQKAIDKVGAAFKETQDWGKANLVAQLNTLMGKCMEAPKADFDTHVSTIKQDYFDGKLLTTVVGGVPKKGTWFENPDIKAKITAAETLFGTTFKANYGTYNSNYTTFKADYDALIAEYDKAVADATSAKLTGKDEYKNMTEAKAALETYFNNIAKGQKYDASTKKYSSQDITDDVVKAIYEGIGTNPALLDKDATVMKSFRDELTAKISALRSAYAAKMALEKAKREAKATLEALLRDNDELTKDFTQRLNELANANPTWKEKGYDVVAAWTGTNAKAENSIPYLQAQIDAFINKKNATASDFTPAKVDAKKTEIQAIIDGIVDASTLEGTAKIFAQRYLGYKTKVTEWTELVKQADDLLKANYPKAYNDPKKAAGVLDKYQASYAASIDSIKATIKVLSDSVASADKTTGNLHTAALKYSLPNLNSGNFPADHTTPYYFSQLKTLLDNFIAGTSDVFTYPLLSDAEYDQMVVDAAEERLIKTCEEKLNTLKGGVATIQAEGDAKLGAAATEIKDAAAALVAVSYDYNGNGKIEMPGEDGLPYGDYNNWRRVTGDYGDGMQGILTENSWNDAQTECRNGNTSILHAYSDYLDYQIAKLNKLKSDVESAKAAVVDNENFYTEKQIEVGGVKVSPEDLAIMKANNTPQTVTDNQLFTLFNTIVGAIEKNDFKKFKVLNSLYVDIHDADFEARYNTLKDAINNTTTGTIQKLAEDLFNSFSNGTIKDDWTKEDGFATQIQNIIKSINMLQTYATDAQATAEAYNAVIDKLVKEDLYDETIDPTTWANYIGLYKDVKDNVKAADPATAGALQYYGGIIVAQYAKINKGEGVVPSVIADYARIKANIIDPEYAGGCDAIDTEAYNDIIDQVLTTLNGLEELSKANLAAYNQQKEYIPGGANDIVATFYAVYGKIEANDKTSKAKDYLTKLQAEFNKYNALKDKEDAEKNKLYSEAADWDLLNGIYMKGEADQKLADDLKAIYDAIKEYEKAQQEGFDAAVVADNITAKEAIRTAIATAKDAFKKAVEAQNDTKAESEVLQAAVAKAESLAPDFYKAIYQFPENIEKRDNELLAEGTGKVDKWIAAHPGKVYDQKADVDKIKSDFTDKLNTETTNFRNAVKDAAKEAVEDIYDDAKEINTLLSGCSQFSLMLNTSKINEAKYAQFGFDSSKNQKHTGLYKKYVDLNSAYTASSFSLKNLDNALKALGDVEQYVKDIHEAFNNVADIDAKLALAEAKKAYDGGEEEFGAESDATEEQKEQWAIDRELYTSEDGTGLLDFYNECVEDDEFTDQLGKQYANFKGAYYHFMGLLKNDGTWDDTFAGPNLYTYMHSSAAALQALQDFEDVLNAAVAPHAAAAKGYGAEGDIQKRIADILQDYQDEVNEAVKDNEEGKVNMKEVTTYKNNLTDKVAQLTPTNLSQDEKAYIEAQMKKLNEQYDKMKKEANAETNEELKATKTKAADQAKKDIDAIQKKVNAVKAIKAEPTNKSDKNYAKDLKAARDNNQEVADAYKGLEPEIEALLKTLSENNGVTADAVKKELTDAIAAAKKAADDALAALDDLTEEEKAAYQEKIDAAKAALDELQAKVNASENIIGDKDKLASQIAAVQDDIDYTVGNAGAADAATKAKKTASDAAAELALATLETIEEDIAQIKEDLKNPEMFKYITENVYAKRLAGVETAIADLKAEIEEHKADYTVPEYLAKEDEEGNNIYVGKLANLNALVDRLKTFTAEQEIKAYADDLQKQADAIVIDESKYTATDFTDLTKALKDIKDAIYEYTPAVYDLTTDPATELSPEKASGLKQDIKDGLTIFDDFISDPRDGLAEEADDIQEAINDLLKQIDELNIAPEPEIVVPGDITGGGTGEVSDDDIAAFMDAFLADELPSSADPLFAVYDANGDGVLNIADAQAIMNLSAGLNADGTVPGGDLSRAMEAPAGNLTVETESLMNGVTRLTLNFEGNFEYTGFQMDVKGGEVLSESSMNNSLRANTLADGTRRIAAIGTANGNGQVVVIETKGQVELTNVALTTADAKGIVFTLDNATGIYGINADNSNNTIYDLGGKIVNGMKKGVNIIRDAFGNVKKAILK